ncbi:unnamed protein product [Prorocentrum cordatum]|uniref:IBR domain-containing protein n=1 Tax=Prorocentrum cordatum TaxID=2364126 RepID=A0ABN9U4R5_9DINO|nr:unnamed protein product [Polarella glacialis]
MAHTVRAAQQAQQDLLLADEPPRAPLAEGLAPGALANRQVEQVQLETATLSDDVGNDNVHFDTIEGQSLGAETVPQAPLADEMTVLEPLDVKDRVVELEGLLLGATERLNTAALAIATAQCIGTEVDQALCDELSAAADRLTDLEDLLAAAIAEAKKAEEVHQKTIADVALVHARADGVDVELGIIEEMVASSSLDWLSADDWEKACASNDGAALRQLYGVRREGHRLAAMIVPLEQHEEWDCQLCLEAGEYFVVGDAVVNCIAECADCEWHFCINCWAKRGPTVRQKAIDDKVGVG